MFVSEVGRSKSKMVLGARNDIGGEGGVYSNSFPI